MSFFKKLLNPSESGEMKKIREEAEKRRASKSSAGLPRVADDVIGDTITKLSSRIETTDTTKK
jgi:hypothetical protein